MEQQTFLIAINICSYVGNQCNPHLSQQRFPLLAALGDIALRDGRFYSVVVRKRSIGTLIAIMMIFLFGINAKYTTNHQNFFDFGCFAGKMIIYAPFKTIFYVIFFQSNRFKGFHYFLMMYEDNTYYESFIVFLQFIMSLKYIKGEKNLKLLQNNKIECQDTIHITLCELIAAMAIVIMIHQTSKHYNAGRLTDIYRRHRQAHHFHARDPSIMILIHQSTLFTQKRSSYGSSCFIVKKAVQSMFPFTKKTNITIFLCKRMNI